MLSNGTATADDRAASLASAFSSWAGAVPEGTWRAPGRVNLIGDHTDYNDGWALPFAISPSTWVTGRRRSDGAVRLRTDIGGTEIVTSQSELVERPAQSWPGWARYPLGALWSLARDGLELGGMDLDIASELPLGSGLSSSASVMVATAMAASELARAPLVGRELAQAAQRGEVGFIGTPAGMLDQLAVVESKAGTGVLIDFESLDVRPVGLGGGPFTVLDTRVVRQNSSGTYAQRRRQCEEAARALGLPSLRHAREHDLSRLPAGPLRSRAAHVVSEDARVLEVVRRLGAGQGIGDLLLASHASLRHDYQVSCPQLDLAVATAMATGAQGARLTGAGMGGCAIALGVRAGDVVSPLEKAFAEAGFDAPTAFDVVPGPGACRWA